MGTKRYVNLGGHKYTFNQLSDMYDIKRNTIYFRYMKGLRGKDLIKTPDASNNRRKLITFKGQKMTIDELAQKAGVNRTLIRGREYAGLKDDDLIKPKKKQQSYVPQIRGAMRQDPEFEPIITQIDHGTPISQLSKQEKSDYKRGYRRYLARIYRHRPDKVASQRKYYQDYYYRKGKAIRQREPREGGYPSNWAKYFHKYYIQHPDKVKENTERWQRRHNSHSSSDKTSEY